MNFLSDDYNPFFLFFSLSLFYFSQPRFVENTLNNTVWAKMIGVIFVRKRTMASVL